MNGRSDTYDFVVIGAGGAGEAAAYEARRRGGSVAVIDRELFGGSCPYWACMPSKTLLHAAGVAAAGGDYPWQRASDRRDYMINREGRDWPDDGGHVRRLEAAGATVIRGDARITGPGRVQVRLADGTDRAVDGSTLVIAVGSNATIPDIPGLAASQPWTNREATSARELPRSLLVLGGGPTGVELAQVYARYGVPVTLVHPDARLNHRDHPRNSAALERALAADGVSLRLGVRAERVDAGHGRRAHRVQLTDGSTINAHAILLALGRTVPLEGLGLEHLGVHVAGGRVETDGRLRISPDTFLIGDAAGGGMSTHLADYEGRIAVAIAMGDDVRPDLRAIPHATYTDPETAGVGLQPARARELGLDVFEKTVDLSTTAKGYVTAATGHATIVVDRRSGTLVGAFIAGPGAAEAINMAVLAVKLATPLEVLAETVTAFPTTARVLAGLFVSAAHELGESGTGSRGESPSPETRPTSGDADVPGRARLGLRS